MAINSAILAPFKIGGVIALSGGVFPSLQNTINADSDRFADKKKTLSIFIYHGMRDQVVTYPHAKESYDQLRASGFEKVQFTPEEKLDHSFSLQEIEKIKEFFNKVLV